VVSYFLSLVLQTQLYIEDWIGLKTLDEAGRVKYISVSGNHLGISRSDMKKYVVPYLEGKASGKIITEKDGDIRVHRVHHKVVPSNKKEQSVPQFEESASTKVILKGSSSYWWPSSIKSFIDELLGLTEESLSHS
jgi:palmitoyl-protein thioesterase